MIGCKVMGGGGEECLLQACKGIVLYAVITFLNSILKARFVPFI